MFSLKGSSVQVDITEDGRVKEVHGIDELIIDISRRSKLEVNTVTRNLSDCVSANAIKDLLNRILSIPRNQEVKVSDSWVKNIVLITKAPIKVSNIYSLKKISGDSAYVDIQSVASTETASKGDNVYLNGKQEGEAILSVKTGMPFQYTTTLETVTKTSYYDVTYRERFLVKGSSPILEH